MNGAVSRFLMRITVASAAGEFMADRNPTLAKTVFSVPSPKLLAEDPFNRLRWALNEIQGKWEAATRGLLEISTCSDLRKARGKATETLQIMSRVEQKS